MNYHQSFMNFCHHFFLPFCECLGTFSCFPVCQVFFYLFILFLKRFFIFSLPIRLKAGLAGRRHIWTSLPRYTAILVGVLSKLRNS